MFASLLLFALLFARPTLSVGPLMPPPGSVKEGREPVQEPRRLSGPVFVVEHARPFRNASARCVSEDAMFRLPAQRGLQLALARAVKEGTFSAACASEVLERALLSHPKEVVKALLRYGARPTRAHAALLALPRACDRWGLHAKETLAHDLAMRRRELWDALLAAEPDALTEKEKKEWIKNITLCFAEFWVGEYQDLWVSVDSSGALGADAPHRAWAELAVNADGTPTKEADWQWMGVKIPTLEERGEGPAAEAGREEL
jgi:hypothetical protein